MPSNFQEYDLHGTPLGPMGESGPRDGAMSFPDSDTAARYFRKELDRQKSAKGKFGSKTSALAQALGMYMEGNESSPESIKRWIGQDNYTGPTAVDGKLEGNVNKIDYQNPQGNWGRNGDMYTAHVAPGEMVVPPVISPELRARIEEELAAQGISLDEFTVGDPEQKINPMTGEPEFFFKKIKRLAKSVVRAVNKIPVVGPVVAPAVGFYIAGPQGAAFAAGAQTKLQGGSWGQAIGSAAGAYIGGQVGGPGSGTVGSTLSDAGLGSVSNALGTTLSNVTIPSITGSMLGSSIGNAIGGALNPPSLKNDANAPLTINSTPAANTPVGVNTGGVAIPGGQGDANAPTAAPDPQAAAQAAQRGVGVTVGTPNASYQNTVIDRYTGLPRTVNTSFSNNFDRRGSWGSGVSFA